MKYRIYKHKALDSDNGRYWARYCYTVQKRHFIFWWVNIKSFLDEGQAGQYKNALEDIDAFK